MYMTLRNAFAIVKDGEVTWCTCTHLETDKGHSLACIYMQALAKLLTSKRTHEQIRSIINRRVL